MNDGGGESGSVRGIEEEVRVRYTGGRGDFARAIAQISVAQICESEGYQAFRQSTLETLADIAIRYIQGLGKSAHDHANAAGRTESNVFDVIQALEDLSCSFGFMGASDINHSLWRSGAIREVMQYTSLTEDVPFARHLPHFPIIRDSKPLSSFLRIGETPPEAHIPPWLPAFPDTHTYRNTPVMIDRATNPRTEKIEQARQQRRTERSLVNLQQRLMLSSATPSTYNVPDVDAGGGGKVSARRQVENPFLLPPLRFGEKKVSYVPLPPNFSIKPSGEAQVNLPSLVEAFGPAIESAKNEADGNGERQLSSRSEQILPSERPAVNFRLISSKTVGPSSLNSSVQNFRNSGNKPLRLSRDEVKDDKKKESRTNSKGSYGEPTQTYSTVVLLTIKRIIFFGIFPTRRLACWWLGQLMLGKWCFVAHNLRWLYLIHGIKNWPDVSKSHPIPYCQAGVHIVAREDVPFGDKPTGTLFGFVHLWRYDRQRYQLLMDRPKEFVMTILSAYEVLPSDVQTC